MEFKIGQKYYDSVEESVFEVVRIDRPTATIYFKYEDEVSYSKNEDDSVEFFIKYREKELSSGIIEELKSW